MPDAGLLPVAQSSPAGRAAAAALFLREQSPRATGSQGEDDATRRGTIRHSWATTFRFGRLLRQQRFNGFHRASGTTDEAFMVRHHATPLRCCNTLKTPVLSRQTKCSSLRAVALAAGLEEGGPDREEPALRDQKVA